MRKRFFIRRFTKAPSSINYMVLRINLESACFSCKQLDVACSKVGLPKLTKAIIHSPHSCREDEKYCFISNHWCNLTKKKEPGESKTKNGKWSFRRSTRPHTYGTTKTTFFCHRKRKCKKQRKKGDEPPSLELNSFDFLSKFILFYFFNIKDEVLFFSFKWKFDGPY